MTYADNNPIPGDATAEVTAALRAELLGAPGASAATDAESVVTTVNELPSGSAVLIVKRGPNVGARFVLRRCRPHSLWAWPHRSPPWCNAVSLRPPAHWSSPTSTR